MENVQIIAPESSGSMYFNYRGTFSVVLLGVANTIYNFICADFGCQGRISDGGVFKYTSLYETIEQGNINLPADETLPGRTNPVLFVFVAEDEFALATYIMKPYPGHKPGESSPERIFNYRLSKVRRIIENLFGILSPKFRVLFKPIVLHLDNVESAVFLSISTDFYVAIQFQEAFIHHKVNLIQKTQMGTLFRDYGDQEWITHIL
jgi:hypothetical protein